MRVLSGTGTAPRRIGPSSDSRKRKSFENISATRSPAPTPSCARALAIRLHRASSSSYVSSTSSWTTATLDGASRSGASKRYPRLSGRNDHLAEHLAAGQRDLALRGALEGKHAVDDRREPP